MQTETPVINTVDTTYTADTAPTILSPFGFYFRQKPAPLPVLEKGQTTSEPEITTGDGNDPDKIDADWIPDEDEEEEDIEEAATAIR